MEVEDHFDPFDFYSNEPQSGGDHLLVNDTVTVGIINHHQNSNHSSDSNKAQKPSTNTNLSLRRSGRPKPAADSLISSPPAIKFYESTVIRKTEKAARPSSRSAAKNKSSDGSPLNSKVLKLRLSNPDDSQISQNESKENVINAIDTTPKRNLRVVKLMMPDITDDEHQKSPTKSPAKSPVKPAVKVLPLLAPKPATTANNGLVIKMKEFKLRERKPTKRAEKSSEMRESKKSESEAEPVTRKKRRIAANKLTPSADNNMTVTIEIKEHTSPAPITTEPLRPHQHIINEDVCYSCGGLGNFICCDACPRSFHFTCAEPPLDPQNLPKDDWYCNECQAREVKDDDRVDDIWGMMISRAEKSNPKCFVMPRRFRYQPKEEDLIKLQTGQLFATKPTPPVITTTPTPSQSSIIINNVIKIDHCGYEILAPTISTTTKSCSGYCHCCGRYGLTKHALTKIDEMPSVPSDPRYHRPILSCSICPLYWHLDCLDPPLVNFPPPSTTWTCPIHFTSEQCIALDVAESLVQASTLLPESAIQLQFKRKIDRMREQRQVNSDGDDNNDDEEDKIYGVTRKGVLVPESIKSVYQ